MNNTQNNQRGPGRPRTVRRTVFVNPETKQLRPKGRVGYGSKWIECEIDRAVPSDQFNYATTPIYSQREITVTKESGASTDKANVVIIEAENNVVAEVSEPQKTEQILAPAATV